MTTSIVRLALAFCLLAVSAPVRAQTIFSDNFNSGASPLWGNEVGSWIATGGVYDAQAPNNNPITYSSLPFNLTNFAFDVDINAIRDGGIWLRSSDNGNGILLVTGGGASGFTGLYWHRIVGGNIQDTSGIVTGLFTPDVSNPHLRVEVYDDLFLAFVDGSTTPATSYLDSTFSEGKVALYDFSGQTFDNVVLTAVPEPGAIGLIIAALLGAGLLWWRKRYLVSKSLP